MSEVEHRFDAESRLSLCFESGEMTVRHALRDLKSALSGMGLAEDDIGSVEIVLGEVLNNVVEHAYGPARRGQIEVGFVRKGHVLRFCVADEGEALPDERLPAAELPCADGALETLPEGGFGWYLVQHLACDLAYSRARGRNELAFSILCGAGE